jgi:hypothetical protein
MVQNAKNAVILAKLNIITTLGTILALGLLHIVSGAKNHVPNVKDKLEA